MCGINGYISKHIEQDQILKMNNILSHRGPDDTGFFYDKNVALGHNRLSIHDLSELGKQPMFSRSKKWVIVFNGEIYNYKTLRSKFNLNCVSDSDTEVLVELIDKIGVNQALNEIIGMFAFSAYNITNSLLYLARDRAGEKPLFYYLDEKNLIFSSELKSIYPLINKQIDSEALRSFFYYSYVPEAQCIISKCNKVKPGTYIEINTQSLETKSFQYWSIDEKQKKIKGTYKKSFDQAVKDLDSLLCNVIEEQLDSDVPIGCFLSGGIDSSIVTAISQKISHKPINTFSIGFDIENYNEANFAKIVADTLKTHHTELYATPNDCIDLIKDLSTIFDEPFSDSSQIPTLLLSRLTKKYVTVCLSGDGGDEVFGGYSRYFLGDKIYKYTNKTPKMVRNLVSKTLLSFNTETLDMISPISGDKLHKLANLLRKKPLDFYTNLISHWKDESPLCDKSLNPHIYTFSEGDNIIEKMMLLDFQTYMCSDIFTKVDRTSMSTSLETRAPLVDKRVVEFALSLPFNYKVNNGNGKYILKELLYKYIDKSIVDRPKMGFGVPIEQWLRNELKNWATNSIQYDNEYLDSELLNRYLNEHMTGKRNWSYLLWDVIMFQEWYKNYIKN